MNSQSQPKSASPDSEPVVTSISSKGLVKYLRLQDGRRLEVHRFACAGVGDVLKFGLEGKLWVRTNDGDVPILPPFRYKTQLIPVAEKILHLDVHEITTTEQYRAYEALSQYHYRTQNAFGGRAILLMTCLDSDFPSTLGFIEITLPFLHVRNRSRLFDSPFSEPGRLVSWPNWDQDSNRKFINVIARISRMVIHPEVRGIGLSRILIQAAEEFCKTRWHIKKLRPLFLEITADMLKFMPFVNGAGMRWIGDSTGNLSRVKKDMEYLAVKVKGQEDHWINRPDRKGIASSQRKNVYEIIRLEEELSNQKLDVFVELERIIRDETIASETYEKLMPLLRFPKPTYMKGLSRNADAFIQKRCVELGLQETKHDELQGLQVCSSPIRIKNLTLEFAIDAGFLGRSDTGRIRQAFGLSREFRFRTGIRNLTVTVHPGEICYLYGPSGAGKTWLLRLLASLPDWKERVPVTGEVSLPSDGMIGTLEEAIPAGPLVQAIGPKSLGHAIAALNASGLAEPRLYLSQYEDLSAGQKYRAQLARLLCSDSNIWLLDEFSSNLDDATSLAVGRNFARAARKREVICFIATVRRQPLVNAISPDLVIELNQVGDPNVWRDWRDWEGVVS